MPRKSPHFYWQVPQHGFKWITGSNPETGNDNTAIILRPVKTNDHWQRYYPLKNHTGLIQEFARLEINKESILDFANQFGSFHSANLCPENGDTGNTSYSESLADWQDEILAIRQVLELWQMASTKDYQNLSTYVHRTKNGILVDQIYNPMCPDHAQPFYICTEDTAALPNDEVPANNSYLPVTEKTLAGLKKDKPCRVALYLIQHITNYKINGLIKPQLMLDDNTEKLNLKMKPSSLIGALWLQCMMALNNNKAYATCSSCNKWFELPKNVINKGKKYCSDACKSKAYRTRKKKKVA